MSGALVAQAINESIGTPGFRGIDAILEEYLGRIAEQAGTTRVPISRTINGHPLSSDVNLTNDDVGSAPAGFGLGGISRAVEDANNVYGAGFYIANSNTPDGSKWYILNQNYSSANYAKQLAFSITSQASQIMCMRTKLDKVWSEWEYVNPPMRLGVEYRTTERFNGNPVYVVAMDLGTLPTSGDKDVYYPVSLHCENIVSYDVIISNPSYGARSLPTFANDGSIMAYAWSLNATIRITVLRDMSGYNGRAIVKYTKD